MSDIGIKTRLGIAVCKASRMGLRLAKSGGTAFPGKAAMRFDPDILGKVSDGMEVILVTGTNGKTTTCHMLEKALSSTGRNVLANRSGSNLLRGITADFVANADINGKPSCRFAIIECDEAALKQVAPLVKPKVILVTNIFSDQLDRYGSIENIAAEIKKGVELAPGAVVCLNADCALTSSIALDIPNKVVYYGFNCAAASDKEADISDTKNCIRCGAEYEYEYHTYDHLGSFYCPKCGYRRQTPQTAVSAIRRMDPQGSDVVMEFTEDDGRVIKREVHISLPVIYNIYNAAGAVCAYTAAGFGRGNILKALANMDSSFGRFETFELNGIPIQMILVKNAAGCNMSIGYVSSLKEDYEAVFCLNNTIADGQDISWIEYSKYETLAEQGRMKKVLVSGDCAAQLKDRLIRAGVREEDISVIDGWKELVEEIGKSEYPVYILPNYSTMLALRGELAKATGKEDFWK